MFVTKLALTRSEHNIVTKFNHVTHLAWGLYYMAMPNWLPQAQSRGHYRSKSGGRFTIEYYNVGHQAGPRNE